LNNVLDITRYWDKGGGEAMRNSLCQIIADGSRAEVWRMNTMRETSAISSAVIGIRGLGLGNSTMLRESLSLKESSSLGGV
jgi:hypothetical protein